MQRNLLSVFLLAVLVTGIVSCNHTDKSGIAIPKDAALAIHIKTASLTSKVSWQEIQQTEWFNELYNKQADTLGRQLLNDPTKSGIDVQADLAFFAKKQGGGGYMAFEGSVKDAGAFEAFAQKINKGGQPAKNGDINVLITGLTSLVAWNNSRFVYISNLSGSDITSPLHGSYGQNEPYSFKTDSLQKFAIELFDLPHNNNLTSDDRFASLLKETGDVHYWVNAEQYSNNMAGILSVFKADVLFEGNVYGTTLNFENGKISLKSKAWYNNELRTLLEKYPSTSVSADMINRIPSQNVVAVFAFKYHPEAFKDLTKLLGVDGFLNGFFGSVDYSTDEFVKATKGDVLISVSDFSLKQQKFTIQGDNGDTYSDYDPVIPNANVLFATSVNDKPSFDKLFGILQKTIQEYAPDLASKAHFQLNNEWFAASNAPEQVNGFLAGGNNHFPFTSRISGHAFGGYIDVHRLMQLAAPSLTDSSAKAALNASLNMWQDIVITSGGEKNGAFTGEAEITLVDKNANSLKQLNQYIDTITKIFNHDKSRYDVQALPYGNPATLGLAMLAPAMRLGLPATINKIHNPAGIF